MTLLEERALGIGDAFELVLVNAFQVLVLRDLKKKIPLTLTLHSK